MIALKHLLAIGISLNNFFLNTRNSIILDDKDSFKLILMSATINAIQFSEYFSDFELKKLRN